ncbi:SAM-dependent methyltransferase [Paractinoplanes rhizophilus]|jgi:SAM-dependent methyltransferase|uniref:SAM-dependent methyltransferase n=1 Tax=Paractinoplanes rhizophilus TaxID=1416877 RepID=A0ABW2HK07_9ACTN|nr:SAM-dependent methyltransferase [Actinoplanes sp.]
MNSSDRMNTSVAHPARRYNYWLGGKDHFAADRESGDLLAKAFPTARIAALENRDFLRRSVKFLAESGIRQFLDIGTGLPVPDNTHEVAQRVAPESRVLYVDNDPIVMAHSRALTVGTPAGRTGYVEADLRSPEAILGHPELRAVLDLRRPVGLLLVAVLHFIHDDEQAVTVVRQLLDALAPGSYLVASNLTLDYAPPEQVAKHQELLASGRTDARARDRPEFARFFAGLDLIEPGVVSVSDWRPARDDRPTARDVAIYGAVGRKP